MFAFTAAPPLHRRIASRKTVDAGNNCSRFCVARRQPIRAAISDSENIKVSERREVNKPKTVSWKNQWYPVITEIDAPKDEPYGFKVFDMDLVLFQRAPGKWAVLDDRCSHRLAPLSEGRIVQESPSVDAEVECPYHGWRFDGCGSCTRIPQLEKGGKIPRRASVKQYKASVKNEVIWVFLGDSDKADSVSIFEPEVAKGLENINYVFMRDVYGGFEMLLENTIDTEHTSWLHHGVLPFFDRANGGNVSISVKVSEDGLSVHSLASSAIGDIRNGVAAPSTAYVDFRVPGVFRSILLFYVCPISRIRSRMFLIEKNMYENPIAKLVASLTPRWYRHLKPLSVSDGDVLLLDDLQRNVGQPSTWKKKWVLLPKKLDGLVIAYRSWMDSIRDSIPWQSEPSSLDSLPRLTRRTKLDRLEAHTLKSLYSRGAMKGFQLASSIADFVAKLCVMSLVSLTVAFLATRSFIVENDQLQLLLMLGGSAVVLLFIALALRRVFDEWANRFIYTDEARLSMVSE